MAGIPLWLRCQAQCFTRRPPANGRNARSATPHGSPRGRSATPHGRNASPHGRSASPHGWNASPHGWNAAPHGWNALGGRPAWTGQTVAAAAPNSRLKSEAVPRSSGLNAKAPAAETAPAPAAETAPTPAPPLLMAAEPAPTQANQMAAEPTPTEPAQITAEPTPAPKAGEPAAAAAPVDSPTEPPTEPADGAADEVDWSSWWWEGQFPTVARIPLCEDFPSGCSLNVSFLLRLGHEKGPCKSLAFG